jgi:hypothetical protein
LRYPPADGPRSAGTALMGLVSNAGAIVEASDSGVVQVLYDARFTT